MEQKEGMKEPIKVEEQENGLVELRAPTFDFFLPFSFKFKVVATCNQDVMDF